MKQLISRLVRMVTPRLRRRPDPAGEVQPSRDIIFPQYLGDLSVYVDPSNGIEFSMMHGYDPDLARAFARFVKPGGYCIDVGANVGAVTLHLAKLVGPGGMVVAVEPGPPYGERLRRNIALNPQLRGRITVVSGGVGAKRGTLRWQADPNARYNAVLLDRKPWPADGTEVRVRVETLDRLVTRLRLPRVDFVKVDVEGMELEVFRGGLGTLRAFRPAVLFETMPWAREYRRQVSGTDVFAEIDALLRSVGYSTHEILDDGTLRPVSLLAAPPENTLALPHPAPGTPPG